jgi:type 1 glutamine amidotransferase
MHAASHNIRTWPWFNGLLGAILSNDKNPIPGTLTVVNKKHLSTKKLPKTFTRIDQWMEFEQAPKNVKVLLTINGELLKDYTMNSASYPVSWCHKYEGGRSFYTTFGHDDYYDEPEFANHILGGIKWVSGLKR